MNTVEFLYLFKFILRMFQIAREINIDGHQ